MVERFKVMTTADGGKVVVKKAPTNVEIITDLLEEQLIKLQMEKGVAIGANLKVLTCACESLEECINELACGYS